jgi:hypothetical protein
MKPFGQIYAIVDPFCEQLGGRVQYIGKHKLCKNEVILQESLEKYLAMNIKRAKREKFKESKRPYFLYLRNEIRDCFGTIYEKPKIEQVEVCYSESELNQREEHWRLFFKGFYPNLLNIAHGGAGGWSEIPWNKGLTKEIDDRVASYAIKDSEALKGNKHALGHVVSEASRKTMSNSHIGRVPWNKGLTKETDIRLEKAGRNQSKIRQENKEKYSGENSPFFGKHHSEETKQKISKKNVGNKNALGRIVSQESRIAMSNAQKGKKLTEEHRKNIGNGQRGKKRTEDAKRNMSIAAKNRERIKRERKNE